MWVSKNILRKHPQYFSVRAKAKNEISKYFLILNAKKPWNYNVTSKVSTSV